jgi:hypothetical protein
MLGTPFVPVLGNVPFRARLEGGGSRNVFSALSSFTSHSLLLNDVEAGTHLLPGGVTLDACLPQGEVIQ